MTQWNRINTSDRRRHARILSGAQGINLTVGDKPAHEQPVMVKTKEKEWVERLGDYDFIYKKKPPKIKTLG